MRKLIVRGSFRSAGAQIGEETRSDLPFVRDLTVAFLLEHASVGDLARMRRIAADYVHTSRAVFPEALEFLEGMAFAGEIPFDDLALIAFSEEIRSEFVAVPMPEKCTTICVRTPDGWLIGHNEDYEPQYFGKMYALDLRVTGYPRVLALCYPGHFPCLAGSLNWDGVAIANNSLWPDAQPGLSKNVLHFRAALARSMDEAIAVLTRQPAALTGHYTVAWGQQDDLVGLEVSNATTAETTVVAMDPADEGTYCHANHVRFLTLRGEDPAVTAKNHSLDRQAKAEAILSGAHPPSTPLEMLEALSTNDGVLHRTAEQNPTSVTLASVVIRPRSGELWIRDAAVATPDRDLHLRFGRPNPDR